MASTSTAMNTVSGVFQGVAGSVVVHKDHTGFILGRKCATVNAVQRNTNTRIKWQDLDSKDASHPLMVRFTICGRSQKDVGGAYEELLRIGGVADRSTPRAHLMPVQNQLTFVAIRGLEMRCFVPDGSVGLVLGRGGNRIAQISNSTGTWAKFFKANPATKVPACFSVRGFYEADVKQAVSKIESIVEGSQSAGRPAPLTVADVMQLKSASDAFDTAFAPPQSPDYKPPTSPTYSPPLSPASPKGGFASPDFKPKLSPNSAEFKPASHSN